MSCCSWIRKLSLKPVSRTAGKRRAAVGNSAVSALVILIQTTIWWWLISITGPPGMVREVGWSKKGSWRRMVGTSCPHPHCCSNVAEVIDFARHLGGNAAHDEFLVGKAPRQALPIKLPLGRANADALVAVVRDPVTRAALPSLQQLWELAAESLLSALNHGRDFHIQQSRQLRCLAGWPLLASRAHLIRVRRQFARHRCTSEFS